jgi:high-affinity K+ transport system ATPase subunit B
MIKGIAFALLFIVIGAVVFALLAPLAFRGADFKKLGAAAFPVILLVCGGAGFFFGLRRSKMH